MNPTPDAAALELIRAAKADEQAPSREIVERATGGLDADGLRTTLVLLWAVLPGLYAVLALSKQDWDRKQQATFGDLVERFYGPRDAIPAESATVVAARAAVQAARQGGEGFTAAVDAATLNLRRSELVEVVTLLAALCTPADE